MPQIMVEYSADIQFSAPMKTVVSGLHKIMQETPWINIETVKTRLHPVEHYFVGLNSDKKFIHMEIKIFLKDRTDEMIQGLLDNFLVYFKSMLNESNPVELTAEASFLKSPHYKKLIVNA
ncbi:hypothetical protein N8865_00090 [Francisellaceae bacterium]|nr:hypothetical protein [Francisellaceae bacterium]